MSVLLIALFVACGSSEPQPAADEPSAPLDPPADATAEPPKAEPPKAETAEERRARLMAEADRRAGLEPGQPLPKWDLSALADAPPPKRECKAGTFGTLELSGGDVATATIEALLASPAAVDLTDGRHAGERGLAVSRLVGTGSVTLTDCNGEKTTIDASANAKADALVLVPNSRGELKLIDTSASDGGRKPLARNVTVLAR